jgi:hypothetical protein
MMVWLGLGLGLGIGLILGLGLDEKRDGGLVGRSVGAMDGLGHSHEQLQWQFKL